MISYSYHLNLLEFYLFFQCFDCAFLLILLFIMLNFAFKPVIPIIFLVYFVIFIRISTLIIIYSFLNLNYFFPLSLNLCNSFCLPKYCYSKYLYYFMKNLLINSYHLLIQYHSRDFYY